MTGTGIHGSSTGLQRSRMQQAKQGDIHPPSPGNTMIEMRRKIFQAVVTVAAALSALSFGAAHAAWPDRPGTLVVPSVDVGDTDSTARIIGALLEKELGQPVHVVNRTGGKDVVGHQAIAGATHDGYTLGMATVDIA